MRHSVWCVLKNVEGKYLLLKRANTANNGGQWNFPGGGIEPGEDILAAGAREFHEECGVAIHEWKKIKTIVSNTRVMHFIMPAAHHEPNVVINHESSKFGWLTLEQISSKALHKPTSKFFKNQT